MDQTVDNNNRQIASPCVRNCCLNEDDVCLGCFRHVDEIMEWSMVEDARRECILENAKKRRVEHDAKWNKQV
ncbi:DUF1289 domain-containing protein [Beggiatoa alba]|nr:DUF1289 domain-containing protein [Beggiatoa alba]